jgi:tetratricopeptide (TPR) repeat protein
MLVNFQRAVAPSLFLFCFFLGATPASAQVPMGGSRVPGLSNPHDISVIGKTSNLDIHLMGTNGQPIEVEANLTLINMSGQVYRQGVAKGGRAKFNDMIAREYKVLVIAPGFEQQMVQVDLATKYDATITIQLRTLTPEDPSLTAGLEALPQKAQKELGKALAQMHSNNLNEALVHLEGADKIAPNRAEVSYLFGMYYSRSKNVAKAESYWTKTLELNPQHSLALLSLGQAYFNEDKYNEALPYLKRAVEAEPTSWRANAFLANTELRLGSADDAIQHAERALELGHGQADRAQLILAAALAKKGEKERAITAVQAFLKDHASDDAAKKQLEKLQAMAAPASDEANDGDGAIAAGAAGLPEVSNWLPQDIDEKMPPVEAASGCNVDEVLQGAGKRVEEFVRNVDRFTATESLNHQTIDKWGMASSPERLRFEYLVSMEEVAPGFLSVEEYRSNRNKSAAVFPDGIQTNGLPALALIFHPYNAGSFEMTCEGLARRNGGMAWQVHFRQRNDKPNRIRTYRIGVNGPSYPVGLKGRAWISADTYQILRLETGLIVPIPEIRLKADRTAVEYGPVRFKNRKVEMWLPKTAEVYYDWRGHRTHRRHSFDNYLLFAVDDRQKIEAPKVAQEPTAGPGSANPEN